jgi:hypothetical protein
MFAAIVRVRQPQLIFGLDLSKYRNAFLEVGRSDWLLKRSWASGQGHLTKKTVSGTYEKLHATALDDFQTLFEGLPCFIVLADQPIPFAEK